MAEPIVKTNGIIEVGVASMERISRDSNVVPVWENPNNVTFNVQYGKDWKGEKPMPEGPVVVSMESAMHFESIGIGSIGETSAKKKGK